MSATVYARLEILVDDPGDREELAMDDAVAELEGRLHKLIEEFEQDTGLKAALNNT